MKKFALFLIFILALNLITSCSVNDNGTPTTTANPDNTELTDNPEPVLPDNVRVSALKGPTAMGMVKLMKDSEDKITALEYEFKLSTTDEIIPLITKGEIDIAAIPANLASVLYNNTKGKIKVLAINTLGVLYVVEKGDTIKSVADLKGKTVYTTGKGTTPEYAINYVLKQNKIDSAKDLTIEYKSEAAEILPLLVQGTAKIALLPQPFVANALAKVEGLRIALDWTKEWDKISSDDSGLVTGVVVVNSDFLEKYPYAVEIFAKEYNASTEFVNKNIDEAGELVGKYGIVDAAVAKNAIPLCNIKYISGDDMIKQLSGYLKELYNQNPQSVGGELPDDEFYIKDTKNK